MFMNRYVFAGAMILVAGCGASTTSSGTASPSTSAEAPANTPAPAAAPDAAPSSAAPVAPVAPIAPAAPSTMAPRTTAQTQPETTPSAAPAGATSFANCTELHGQYPHGVGLPGAVDHVASGKSGVTTFVQDAALYNANSGLDRDGDSVACEKK